MVLTDEDLMQNLQSMWDVENGDDTGTGVANSQSRTKCRFFLERPYVRHSSDTLAESSHAACPSSRMTLDSQQGTGDKSSEENSQLRKNDFDWWNCQTMRPMKTNRHKKVA